MTSSVAHALLLLNNSPNALFTKIMEHGSMSVELYRPVGVDKQTPHTQDELYVIISGTGDFVSDGVKSAFQPNDMLFVKAGIEHRFENFTEDFTTWVIFYGPAGGENGGL